MSKEPSDYKKGRGAQFNPPNPYQQLHLDQEDWDGIDLPEADAVPTQYFHDRPKNVINRVKSPDIPLEYSINPYQGCEHGCIYCYARNTHQYYGFSAGLDFESKIIVKENVAEVLEKKMRSPRYVPKPVMFSGNTDCYQPVERKLELTRACLKVFVKYHHPVGLITKNSLILRDLDLLKKLASEELVRVMISITTLDESLRRKMEPRTATAAQRLLVIEKLAEAGIPVGVMAAPIIPGLNDHEIPAILEQAAQKGASACGYTTVRLNGPIGEIFEDWLQKNFPDRAPKVLSQIRDIHQGSLGSSEFGARMRGHGQYAQSIRALFQLAKKKHFQDRSMPPYNRQAFRPAGGKQLGLF
jgi:DNA repair photolyase